jgi:hypothetical protein
LDRTEIRRFAWPAAPDGEASKLRENVRHDMTILAAGFIGSLWWYLMCGAILAVAIAAFVIMKKKQKEEEE